jgi:hypothetical protein
MRAVGPLPVQVVGAPSERERHRAGFELSCVGGIVGHPFEAEEVEVAGAGCVRVDEPAHRRVDAVCTDQNVRAGAGGAGEVGGDTVRAERAGVRFHDGKKLIRIDDTVVQNLARNGCLLASW